MFLSLELIIEASGRFVTCPSYYKVEENKVRLLNDDKQEITGALAEHYILNKE